MHDHDHDAILARRALFISAALAGLACTSREPVNEPANEPQDEQVIGAVEPLESPGPAPSVERPSDGQRPSWSEVMANAPPLDIPAGLTKREHELLSYVASAQQQKYDELAKVWSALPECAPSRADCESWAAAVEAIIAAQPGREPLCGYSPETTNTVIERERAHQAYLVKVGQLLLDDLAAAAAAYTDDADVSAWTRQSSSVFEPGPRACLSCMAPTAEPVTEAVAFDADAAVLSASARERLLFVADIHQRNNKARLIIRGHADAGEPEPEVLARQRAEAVAAALVELGVPRRELDVRSYAAALPITSDAAQAALNRRVDFEVVSRR